MRRCGKCLRRLWRRLSDGDPMVDYPGLDFTRAELAEVMRATYDELITFVTTPSFKSLHSDLMSLPPRERPDFVARVFLSPDELAKKGVTVPEGILIQTSAFGDRRPTLFAVKKFLPTKYHRAWENVNITFDSEYQSGISRDPEVAWRPPLPVALQNAMMASDIDLEAAPIELTVKLDK